MVNKKNIIHLDDGSYIVEKNGDKFRIQPNAINSNQLNIDLPELNVTKTKYRTSFDGNGAGEFATSLMNTPMQLADIIGNRLALGSLNVNNTHINANNKIINKEDIINNNNTITPIQDILATTGSMFSPTRWIGTLRSGETPWSENNPGLTGNPYLDMMLDIPLGAKGAKATGKTAKWSYGVGHNIKNRNKHAYVTIDPVGYDNPVDRFKRYAKSILSGEDVDIDAVNPLNRTATTDYVKYNYEKAGKHKASLDNMTRIARDEAWRKYLGLPSRYNIYLDNGDGTFSYNIPEIEKLAGTKYKPYPLDKITHSDVFDNVTGNGGGLTKSEVHTAVAPYVNANGLRDIIGKQIIEDIWDLHPFSKADDLLSAKYARGMTNTLNNVYQKLYPYLYSRDKAYGKFAYNNLGGEWLNKMRNGSMTGATIHGWEIPKLPFADTVIKLSDKLKGYEVGPVLGGKPFKMHTEIPFTKKSKIFTKDSAKNIILKPKGQDPFFDYNYGYEGIVPNGILDDWTNWTNKGDYNIVDLTKLNDIINKTKNIKKVNKKAYGGHIHLDEL